MKDRSVYRIYEGDRFITEGTESEKIGRAHV